jgi:hypothetical protein
VRTCGVVVQLRFGLPLRLSLNLSLRAGPLELEGRVLHLPLVAPPGPRQPIELALRIIPLGQASIDIGLLYTLERC